MAKYKGIYPAFYACYDDEGNISRERTHALVKHLADSGVDGLYVSGSSGECIYQTVEERKQTIEYVMEVAPSNIKVIAHIAAPNTRDSISLAKFAESKGVDAIASIPPIYFTLPDYSVKKYWMDIASSTSLDFIIYNIPQTTGYSLQPSVLKELLEHPQIRGIKNSSVSVQDIIEFKTISDEDFTIFNGPDEQFVGGRAMGADAGIGGTYGVMPKLFVKLDELIEEDIHQATKLQMEINKVIGALVSCHGNLYSVIKGILVLQGINVGSVREPLTAITKEDQKAVEKTYQKIEELYTEWL